MKHLLDILNKQKKAVFITLFIYAVIFIVLLAYQIKVPVKQDEIDGFEVDFEQDEELTLPKIDNNLKEDFIDDKRLNVAVNEALKDNPISNPYDFYNMQEQSDEYKQQLIKEALSPEEYDKYIKDKDNTPTNVDDEISDYSEPEMQEQNNDNKNKNDKQNYQGATYIKYNLKDRYEQKLIIPTYKCEGYGKVLVKIYVNKKGDVTKATVISSSNENDCLNKTAINAALNSKFDENINAPEKQVGTISYTFMPQ